MSSADWEEEIKNQDGQRHCCHDVVANEICVRYVQLHLK